MSSTKNPGRFVGLLYVLILMLGAFALMYVPSKLIVHGNATAMAGNIAASDLSRRHRVHPHLPDPFYVGGPGSVRGTGGG